MTRVPRPKAVASMPLNVALGREDFNEGRTYGGRASVRFEPTENFTMTSLLIYQDSDTDAGFASVTSLGELRSDVPALDPFDDQVQLYGLTTQLGSLSA